MFWFTTILAIGSGLALLTFFGIAALAQADTTDRSFDISHKDKAEQ